MTRDATPPADRFSSDHRVVMAHLPNDVPPSALQDVDTYRRNGRGLDMAAERELIAALGVALPSRVEDEAIRFMRQNKGRNGLFTAKMLRHGVVSMMASENNCTAFPPMWPRRVVDKLIQREKSAGNIEMYGPGRGAGAFWYWLS